MNIRSSRRFVLTGVCAWLLCVCGVALAVTSAMAQGIQPRLVADFLQNGFRATIQIDSTLVCAMEGGLGVLTFEADPVSASEPGHFRIRHFFPLDARPLSLRYDNFTLVVRMTDGSFRFFTLESSLKLREVGRVDYPNEIQDYLYKAGNLYFAEEFRGVAMYHVNSFSSLSFVDSSMVGVRVVQLEIVRDTLYALDDYNGILRYPNPESGLQFNVGYLRLPFQIQSFARHGDHTNLAVGLEGVKSATFDSLGFFASLFERQTVSFASRVLESDSNYIVISTPNVIEIQDKLDPGALQVVPIHGNTFGATLASYGEKQVFVTPSGTFGLLGLWMNVTDYPREFASFDHPGPIRALNIVDGFLYTAGERNPFEKYNLFGGEGPELMGARGFPPGTSAATSIGDKLYLIDNVSAVSQVWIASVSRDLLPLPVSAFGIPAGIDGISIHPDLNAGALILMRAGNKYYVSRAAAGELFGPTTSLMDLGVGVTSATVERGRVYHYSSKSKKITLSELDSFLGLNELFSRTMSGPVNAMLTVDAGQQLVMFSPSRARLFLLRKRFELPSDSLVIRGDFPIVGNYAAAVEREGLIFAVGPNSTGILSLNNDTLVELYHESSGASLVTAGVGVFATSDGSSIKLYEFLQTDVDDEPIALKPADFRLLDNYPNPFNGETLIRFSGSPEKRSEARVVVYNVLGRKVRELPFEDGVGGVVRWDGRDESGSGVASGMYFARLVSGDSSNRRAIKMIYLK
jgi:hypothetical protein